MKKLFYLILCFFITFEIQALTSYEAIYDLNLTSDIGKVKIGNARFKLVTDNNKFTFSSKAFTDSIWKTLNSLSILILQTTLKLLLKKSLKKNIFYTHKLSTGILKAG